MAALTVPLSAQLGTRAPSTPANGTAALSGTVVDGATGRPVAGAIVNLQVGIPGRPIQGPHGRQVSDSRGRFAFTDLPPAAGLTLTASRAGYFDGGFTPAGGPASEPRSLSLADGQWLGGLRIRLWRPGAISGTLRDERGEPVVGVEVRAVAVIPIAGHERLASSAVALTDDRGLYRLAGLPPGRYLVAIPSVQVSVSPFKTQADLLGLSDDGYTARNAGPRPPDVIPTIDAE